jgi:hypothetical protein
MFYDLEKLVPFFDADFNSNLPFQIFKMVFDCYRFSLQDAKDNQKVAAKAKLTIPVLVLAGELPIRRMYHHRKMNYDALNACH